MAGTYSRVKTWSAGETLTASDLNAEFDNVITYATPAGLDDASANATAMQATADPYPAGSASLATSTEGEIQRLRYVLAQLGGGTYWYDPIFTAGVASKYSADAVGQTLAFRKSRNATYEGQTVVQDNDVIMQLQGQPSDGTDFGTVVCEIQFEVDDAAPAASDIGGAIVFSTASGGGADDIAERLRIAADGTITNTNANTNTTKFSADAVGVDIVFQKSRHATAGSHTVVNDNDVIGNVKFCPSDGTDFGTIAAQITGEVDDAAPAASSIGGALVFKTAPGAGADDLREVFRVQADGTVLFDSDVTVTNVKIQVDGVLDASNYGLHVYSNAAQVNSELIYAHQDNASSSKAVANLVSDASANVLKLAATHASYGSQMIEFRATRAGTNAYQFLYMYSEVTSDVEFRFDGDGDASCDGSWSGCGADYSEYYESLTGAALEVGKTVCLIGGMVDHAENHPGAKILGVVRSKEDSGRGPGIIGNTAWNRWKDKYLTDHFGVYLREDATVAEWKDEDGSHSYYIDSYCKNLPDGIEVPEDAAITVQSVRKLNPAFDPESEYAPREERVEWNIIGLLGQCPILKGQPLNPDWIYMKDNSDTVAEFTIVPTNKPAE